MTEREIRKRNNVCFFLLGAVFAGLGIHDIWSGKSAAGIWFLVAGAAFFLQVIFAGIKKKRTGASLLPPRRGRGKNG